MTNIIPFPSPSRAIRCGDYVTSRDGNFRGIVQMVDRGTDRALVRTGVAAVWTSLPDLTRAIPASLHPMGVA